MNEVDANDDMVDKRREKIRGTVGIRDERAIVERRVSRRGEKTLLIQTSHRCCVTHLTTTAIHPEFVDAVLC